MCVKFFNIIIDLIYNKVDMNEMLKIFKGMFFMFLEKFFVMLDVYDRLKVLVVRDKGKGWVKEEGDEDVEVIDMLDEVLDKFIYGWRDIE